jgi:hypothetical protein
MGSSEQYVRPPLVAREPRSPAVAVWRFRLLAIVLLTACALLVGYLFLRFSNVTGGEDPGLGAVRASAAAAG